MEQRLIVEGKDAIVLANLCKLRGMSAPVGYADTVKFRNKFVLDGKGHAGALKAFRETLRIPRFKNVGIILDADQAGVEARWLTLKNLLAEVFPDEILEAVTLSPGGIIVRAENLPTVGIWLMPDNQSNGYLEHFLAGLIPSEDQVWQYAHSTIMDLAEKDFCKFSGIRKQKALVHTWLAWQEKPGLPFGTAAEAGYFDKNSPTIQPFFDWFSNTFDLE